MKATRSDLFWILGLSLAWIFLLQVGPFFALLTCGVTPEVCNRQNIFVPDQPFLGQLDPHAHILSFWTQYATAVLALLTPLLPDQRHENRKQRCLTGVTMATQSILFNGVVNEIVRILIQRPRPHVYGDPFISGLNYSHYSSFYSGHTSFAAAASMTAVLMLFYRKVHPGLIFGTALLGGLLTLSTAWLRVMAGRHFVTDVVTGTIVGALCAWIIYRIHVRNDSCLS